MSRKKKGRPVRVITQNDEDACPECGALLTFRREYHDEIHFETIAECNKCGVLVVVK